MASAFIWGLLIIFLFSDHVIQAEDVRGTSGQTMTLPCTYSVSREASSMCWGRGSCSVFSCDDVIIWTDGRKVTQRQSERYRLLGDMAKGNVSLTIHGVTTSDTGTYCCRVQIKGIFNDIKKDITVKIQEDGSHATTTSTTTTTTFTTTYKPSLQPSGSTTPSQNNGPTSTSNYYMFEKNITEDPIPDIAHEKNQTHSAPTSPQKSKGHGLLIALGCMVPLVITAAIIIYKCRSQKKPHISDGPVQMALEDTDSKAVDNIYIME